MPRQTDECHKGMITITGNEAAALGAVFGGVTVMPGTRLPPPV